MNDLFTSYIGQEQAIRLLRFQVKSFKQTGYFPPVLISSKRGDGKSYLSEIVSKELAKPRLVINASTIKNAHAFVEQIFVPHCLDRQVTLHFDESHCITKSPKLEDLLLSALSPNKNHVNIVDFEGSELVFNNNQLSWIFSTTNIEQHGLAFRNRLKHITLAQYKPLELSKIFMLHVDGTYTIEIDVLDEIISVCRDTARNCVLLADDMNNFSRVYKITDFDLFNWKSFKKTMGINVLGLNHDEINYLKMLSKHTHITLTGLASALEMDRKTCQRAVEPFLLKKGLIGIDVSGRKLTAKGKKTLDEIEA
jgi:Holliday junction resolvasome RuvABC ATP-dependent DNA helicase subunit